MTGKVNALIFGHSHVWSIRRAIASGEFVTRDQDISLTVVLCGTQKFSGTLMCVSPSGDEYLNPALMGALSDYPAANSEKEHRFLVSAVQGNYYNIVGMLDSGDPFDFILPGREDISLNKTGKLIPYGAIVEAISAQSFELLPFYKRLKKLGYAGVVALGTPPPHPDSSQISTLLSCDAKLVNKTISVTSSATRLKLWITQERIMGDICKAAGVLYIPSPISAADTRGFLKTSLCKDAVHGTSEFAALALTDLVANLKRILKGKSSEH